MDLPVATEQERTLTHESAVRQRGLVDATLRLLTRTRALGLLGEDLLGLHAWILSEPPVGRLARLGQLVIGPSTGRGIPRMLVVRTTAQASVLDERTTA
jgi:hypothetical protein